MPTQSPWFGAPSCSARVFLFGAGLFVRRGSFCSARVFLFGAGLPTPPKRESDVRKARICQYLSRFPLFSRGKSSNTPKTLPWTDKFCQIVRKLKPQ
jgi:hypothetical protein